MRILNYEKLTLSLLLDKVEGKDVKSIDKDIGKINDISQDNIQIEKGLVDKDHYSVPKSFVEMPEDDISEFYL